MKKSLVVLICVLLAGVVFVLQRLEEFTLPDGTQQRALSFSHGEDRLQGTLILPAGKTSPPVVLLVHGDAAQDRWSAGGYLPLVNDLVSRGIAVYSWDKPGVGESQGNWLAQTMADRAGEAAAAFSALKAQPELAHSRMGFLGFSQAGWVLPQASLQAKADFSVMVGAAINWRRQGLYFMRNRLAFEGHDPADITQRVAAEDAAYDRTFSAAAVAAPCESVCTRDDFERRNARSDALADIARMTTPVMLLMGDDDRNVDADESLRLWGSALPATTPRCLLRVPGATHGLLRSRWFDYPLTTQWPLWKQGAFLLAGRHAYAPGALTAMAQWIESGTSNCD